MYKQYMYIQLTIIIINNTYIYTIHNKQFYIIVRTHFTVIMCFNVA